MQTADDLRRGILKIDGRGYKAYKTLKGAYAFSGFTLTIDHVQGDPFAVPSRFSITVPQQVARFPEALTRNKIRQIALADFLIRRFHLLAKKASRNRGIGKSGLIAIDRPNQEVLERTAAKVNGDRVEVRFLLGLPARGRTILGKQAIEMIHDALPLIFDQALKYQNLDPAAVEHHVETVEDAEALRNQLRPHHLLAFVADGAILPRKSGIDPHPLPKGAEVFQSPSSLQVTLDRPNAGKITGMGIPMGVTLIVGGGYHGKSTLLKAVAVGVYNHLPGDGREYVVTDADAVKIRSEDGRGISGVDISPFINNLPLKQPTTQFSTENASGSTSQAANIIEALEVGARLLLIDEDTAATNFMIRDHRMQELISKEKEPITPFIDKVRQLYTDYGVSTLLVIGGSGDYFEAADHVIAMENFRPTDVTLRAKAIAKKYASERSPEGGVGFGKIGPRVPLSSSLNPGTRTREIYLKTHDIGSISFGEDEIDLSAIEQLVEKSQVRAIAYALLYARNHFIDAHATVAQITDRLMSDLSEHGLDQLTDIPYGDLAYFRRFEWGAALNRLRSLEVKSMSELETEHSR